MRRTAFRSAFGSRVEAVATAISHDDPPDTELPAAQATDPTRIPSDARVPARFMLGRVATVAAVLGAAINLLMRADPLTELKRFLTERSTAYEQADTVMDADVLYFQGVVDSVVALTKEKTGG